MPYWYRFRLQNNWQNLFSSLCKMVKTVVTHSKRFTFWGGAGDECLLTPHLIKYVLKIVPKINFKTGHLNFIKKIILSLLKSNLGLELVMKLMDVWCLCHFECFNNIKPLFLRSMGRHVSLSQIVFPMDQFVLAHYCHLVVIFWIASTV